MRTKVLFIITAVVGVAYMGLGTAKAVPLTGVAAPDVQSKSTVEEAGWRRVGIAAIPIQCPTHTTRLPIPTILLRLPFITRLPIPRTPTTGLTATTDLITLLINSTPQRGPPYSLRALVRHCSEARSRGLQAGALFVCGGTEEAWHFPNCALQQIHLTFIVQCSI